MRTEYHDPALVQAIGRAIVNSAAMRDESVVVRVADGGAATMRPLTDDRPAGTRWVFNGFVCEEQRDGQVVRRCIFSPVAFNCIWVDA
jgi:hypothetical protein